MTVRMGMRGLVLAVCGLMAFGAAPAQRRPAPEERPSVTVVDFGEQEVPVPPEEFGAWMQEQGWEALLGSPAYFHIRDGALQLVARPGPIHARRYWLAVWDRDKLRRGIESKVALRMTDEGFRLAPGKYPIIHFRMAPKELPGEEDGEKADLRDGDRDDSAFYLLLGFDSEFHEYQGVELPDTLAYVWANVPWEEPTGRDPDTPAFMRYIPIGHGAERLGEPRQIRRNVADDYRLAYPENRADAVPDVIHVGVMVDSNTVGGQARSALYEVRFEKDEPEGEPSSPVPQP